MNQFDIHQEKKLFLAPCSMIWLLNVSLPMTGMCDIKSASLQYVSITGHLINILHFLLPVAISFGEKIKFITLDILCPYVIFVHVYMRPIGIVESL